VVWVDIILTILFIFSFIAGLKEGAVKGLLSLIGLIIAIPVTGYFYHLLTNVLSFIPDSNWQYFLGFFLTFAIALIILALIFFLPVRLFEGIWGKGVIFTLLGGVFSIIGFAVFLVLFTIVVHQYPILYWLEQVLNNSRIIQWLMDYSSVIYFLLPADFKGTTDTVWIYLKFLFVI
jgi:uncharacterized membrane protein required for colicin V production